MSPGRCALPSGMFSTRPMAPTTFARAFRAAKACMSPTTQAAPPMSPFMSSMLAAPLMEMPPVSKHTPLPMKATGCSPLLPPFHRMITVRPGRAEPWATPSSAPIPSLVIALTSSTSTMTPSLRNWPARRANSPPDRARSAARSRARAPARPHPPDGRLRADIFSRRGHVVDRERNLGAQACVLAVFLLGLVAIESIGAQPDPRTPPPRPGRVPWRRRAAPPSR